MRTSVIVSALASTLVSAWPALGQGGPGDEPPTVSEVRHVQTVTGAAGAATSVATSTGISAGADLYVVAVSTKPYEPVASVSGLGLDWLPVTDRCSGRGQTGVSIWRSHGQPSGPGTVTATFATAAGQAVIAVSRYSGVDLAAPIGSVIGANSNGTNGACVGGVDGLTWAIALAADAGSAPYGAVAHRNRAHTPGFGFHERAEIFAGAGGEAASVSVLDTTVEQAQVLTVHGLFEDEVDWAAVVVEILPEIVVHTLDVTTVGGGSVSLDPPGRTFRAGTSVELLAQPDPGWRLQGWSGALSGAANPETLLVASDLEVTATFQQIPDRTVTVTTTGLGGVLLGPPGGLYLEGTEVLLVAEPAPGWRFVRWEGDADGSDNPATLVVAGDQVVNAVFEAIPRRTLGMTVVGSGAVTLSPPGGQYDEGTVVTLDAVPPLGWRFDGWSGSLSGAETPTTIVLDGDALVTARFVAATAGGVELRQVRGGRDEWATELETNGALGAGAGDLYLAAVTTLPPTEVTGIYGLGLGWTLVAEQCGGDGAHAVSVWAGVGVPSSGTPVTAFLAAEAHTAVLGVARYSGVDPEAPIGAVVAANGNGPSGSCLGGGFQSAYSLDLGATAPQSVVFGAVAHRERTHSAGPGLVERLEEHEGDGTDAASVSLVDGDADGVGSVVAGTFSGFVAWAGIAVEIRPQLAVGGGYVLETGTQGLGRVDVDPPGAHYDPGSIVTLTATAEAGWAFDHWSGGASGSANPLSVTMNGDLSISGTFAELALVDFSASAIGAGNVALDPPGGAYPIGAQVTATAQPLRGWSFVRWEGDVTGTSNPVALQAAADRDFAAVFRYDGTPTYGLWASAEEIADSPTIGDGWNEVLFAADENFFPPSISRESDDNVRCLAAAIVHARSGDPEYRQKVVDACDALVAAGIPPGESLDWAREVGAYALAADLVDHRTAALEDWFRNVVEVWEAEDGRTALEMFRERPNNWGAMAFSTLCAVYSYLGDFEQLSAVRGWWIQGVRGPNPGWSYGDLSWHADLHDPRQINPPGASRGGVVIDGALPDDLRRGGGFADPPGRTNYPWGALQGLVAAARILERVDPYLGIWHVEDRAIQRAARLLQVTWEAEYGGWAATGDEAWLLPFLDEAYGTTWSSGDPHEWGAGKNAGWAWVLGDDPLPTGSGIEVPLDAFRLEQNFPNPFGPGTRIRYHLPRGERVRLTIYDVTGRAVATLQDGVQTPGTHTLQWNGVDSGGRAVASGVYWCRITAGRRSDSIKLVLVR